MVPADYVRASTQPQSDPGTGDHYDYQWWVNDDYGYDTAQGHGIFGRLIIWRRRPAADLTPVFQ